MDPNQMPPQPMSPAMGPSAQTPPAPTTPAEAGQATSVPNELISPSAKLPEWNSAPKGSPETDNQKKQLLQKLITNLLNKPGRSMHEMINGVKDIISTYKTFAKEVDSVNGNVQPGKEVDSTFSIPPVPQSAPQSQTATPGNGTDVQNIIRGIQ
jgi:hypothetical protein